MKRPKYHFGGAKPSNFYASCNMIKKVRFGDEWQWLAWFLTVGIIIWSCDNGVDIRPLNFDTDTGCTAPLSDDYLLPYPIGVSYELIQGTCGSFDHDIESRYAFDFAMPIGSIVTAAQDGVVIDLEESFSDGENDRNTDNQLLIEHENGTVGRYLHLTKNGALVEVGDMVRRGDTVALSGNTGFVTTPHLHFDVVNCGLDCTDFNTITIGFLNAEPPLEAENVSYLASPF